MAANSGTEYNFNCERYKMLRTNTKKYLANVKRYILDSIPEELTEELSATNNPTDNEKLQSVYADFHRVANYKNNLYRFPNEQDRLADYLQGLPLHLEFDNYKILQLDKKLREYTDDLTEKQENSLLENYWRFMAYHILKLIRIHCEVSE